MESRRPTVRDVSDALGYLGHTPSPSLWAMMCEESLQRSLARRYDHPSLLDYIARALVVVLFMVGFVAFIYSLFFLGGVVSAG